MGRQKILENSLYDWMSGFNPTFCDHLLQIVYKYLPDRIFLGCLWGLWPVDG